MGARSAAGEEVEARSTAEEEVEARSATGEEEEARARCRNCYREEVEAGSTSPRTSSGEMAHARHHGGVVPP